MTSLYQDYIAISRYARYLPEKKRRESWPETVDRYIQFFSDHTGQNLSFLRKAIVEKDVLPEFFKTVYMNPYSGSSVTWKKAFEWM